MANQFFATTGTQISRKTFAGHLGQTGVYSWRPIVFLSLARVRRSTCLQRFGQHQHWTEDDWTNVLFADVRQFRLSSDNILKLMWRDVGSACVAENVQENDRCNICSITVMGRHLGQWPQPSTCAWNKGDDRNTVHYRSYAALHIAKFFCHLDNAVQDCLRGYSSYHVSSTSTWS